MNAQGSSSNNPDDGCAEIGERRLSGWQGVIAELSAAGVIVLLLAALSLVATVAMAAVVIFIGGEVADIALAAVPCVAAAALLVWPRDWMREPPPERDVVMPDVPGHDFDELLEPTLKQLFSVAREQADIEEARTKSYSDRAGLLLGFAGLILTLAGAEAKDVFEDAASLGPVGRPLGTWFLVAGAVMTSIAGVCALMVLLRRPSTRISTAELAEFLAPDRYRELAGDLLYAQLRALICQIKSDREGNRQLREWFNAGLVALVVALLFLLVHLGIYLERTVESPCQVPKQNSSLTGFGDSGAPEDLFVKPRCFGLERYTDAPAS